VYRTPTISKFPKKSGQSCTDYFVQMTPLLRSISCLLSTLDKFNPIYIQHKVGGAHKFQFLNYKLHNEELKDLYSLPNIVRVIKSRRMRWMEHVARTGERRGVYKVLVGKSEGKDHLEDLGIVGRIILSRKWDGGMD